MIAVISLLKRLSCINMVDIILLLLLLLLFLPKLSVVIRYVGKSWRCVHYQSTILKNSEACPKRSSATPPSTKKLLVTDKSILFTWLVLKALHRELATAIELNELLAFQYIPFISSWNLSIG